MYYTNTNTNMKLEVQSYVYPESYVNKIIESKYVQSETTTHVSTKSVETKKPHFLIECILYENDSDSLLKIDDYLNKRKLELATDLDEQSDKTFDCYNYQKSFKKRLVQANLLKKNMISSIFYVCDYFQKSISIYDKERDIHFTINDKYPQKQIYEFQNGWRLVNSFEKQPEPIQKIYVENLFEDDLKGNYLIYNVGLDSIHKYKLQDLQTIAKQRDVSIMIHSKQKLKKQLYRDIYDNLLKTGQHITT